MLKQILFKLVSFFSFLLPSDFFAKRHPISIKGIVVTNGKIILLKNERNEWELPGGKLEENETPETCVAREIEEELNIRTQPFQIIDTWMYNILDKVKVFIVTYACEELVTDSTTHEKIQISHEHKQWGMFSFEEIDALAMPQGYKNSIKKARKFYG